MIDFAPRSTELMMRNRRASLVYRAHNAVSQAVANGLIPRASEYHCMDCGKPAQAWDHRDYRKPLDVEAVCDRCNHRRPRAGPYAPPASKLPFDHPKRRSTDVENEACDLMCWALKAADERSDYLLWIRDRLKREEEQPWLFRQPRDVVERVLWGLGLALAKAA
jgi:DNA-directed RNA polymerase subunit RPC12/RpoP